ncbi:MAG: CHAP domain-containing protein [Clostridia bacterium]|nr:CHAP domain-containing protein [Clostridia bacterium]
MTKEKIKDFAIRALKTFIQAFLASISVDALIGVTDFEVLKKIAVSILIAAVAAGISAVGNMLLDALNVHLSGKGAGTMTFDAFVKTYLGKAVDFDKAAGKQCVDLIKLYLKECFNINAGAWGNAHAYYDYYSARPALKANFIRIKNSRKFVPMKGDICVWSKKMNKYGHVAIATGKGDTNTFESLDMNWGGKEAKYVTHDYDYFLGVLRPIHRKGIDGKKLYKVKKAVNVRKGPGTGYERVKYEEFTEYQKEQVIANGGKAADNDFPAGMVLESEKKYGNWVCIAPQMWVHNSLVKELT